MSQEFFLILSITLLLSVLITIIIIIALRQTKHRKKKIFENLNSERIHINKNKGSGTVDGIDYGFEYFPGSRNESPFFLIRLSLSLGESIPISFTVKKETRFDRFFKKWGIIHKIVTGDPEFDHQFFITSAYPAIVAKIFSHSSLRKAIQALFKFGYTRIRFHKHQLTAKVIPLKKDFSVNTATLEQAVEWIEEIREKITVEKNSPIPTPSRSNFWRYLVFIKTGLISVFSLVFLVIGLSTYPPFEGGAIFLHSLPYALISYLAFSYIAMRFLQGRSTSHYELIVVWSVALVAFILLGFGLFTTLNGAWDDHPENEIETIILKKYYTKSKNNYTYYAIVESWREGNLEEKIRVSQSQYAQIEKEKTWMQISTKPGKFGYEWLVDYQLQTD